MHFAPISTLTLSWNALQPQGTPPENAVTFAAFNPPIRAFFASVLRAGELPSSPASSPSIFLAKRGTPPCRPRSFGELHGRRPWRVPLGTFPGRAKCPGEFAWPSSSSACTRFGQSWPGVPAPRAPTGRSWCRREPPRKPPPLPCLWLGTDSHRSPLSPSAFGIKNRAP